MLLLAILAPTLSSSTKHPNLPCLRLRHRDYSKCWKRIRIPKPQCLGTAARSAYLVLEWLGGPWGDPILGGDGALSGSNALSYQQQGFGWKQNNTIGSTPQINTWTADWVEFYTQHRLGYQFQRFTAGGHFPQQERLLAAIPNCWHTSTLPSTR